MASRSTSECLSAMAMSMRAAPEGSRFFCSQLRRVLIRTFCLTMPDIKERRRIMEEFAMFGEGTTRLAAIYQQKRCTGNGRFS